MSWKDCDCGMARIRAEIERCSTCEIAAHKDEQIAALTRELDYEPDYWEKLEHQYAGLALQARIIADRIRLLQPAMVGPGDSSTYAAEAAEDARALIAQLKGAALGQGRSEP